MSLSMLNRSIASMAGRASGGTYDVQDYFWGAELNKGNNTYTWSPENDDEFGDEQEHILFLKRAVLGINAVLGERNLVQVSYKNGEDEEEKHPIFSLTLGQEDHCSVDLTFKELEEVTFKLIEGTGPVHIVGNHYIENMREPGMDDTDMDEGEDQEEVEEEMEEPVGKKRKIASPKASPKAKKVLEENGLDTKKTKAVNGMATKKTKN